MSGEHDMGSINTDFLTSSAHAECDCGWRGDAWPSEWEAEQELAKHRREAEEARS